MWKCINPLLIQVVDNGLGRIDWSTLRHDIGLGENLEELIMDKVMTKKVTGEINGIVILRNLYQAVAPSTVAAS